MTTSADCSIATIVSGQTNVKVLVIGGGGREHALAWRLKKSPSVTEVHIAPGNPGTESVAASHVGTDYVQLVENLAVGLPVVGPTAANAALEGSKVHSKRFMEKIGVPTARFATVSNEIEARDALRNFRLPVVLKTDGLAAGKGVIIAQTPDEAHSALTALAYPMVIEEFLEGEELSFFVLCDGKSGVPLEPSQDHKRIFDNDEGPNTGGMGAYSDSIILDAPMRERIMDTIVNPVIRATQFTGFLYAGLLMPADGPSVLEFNVRMGDPETQPLMARLESDWGEAQLAAARGSLTPDALQWSPEPAT